ncbi:hypothetical protein BKA64DRAFT_664448 [Cadophora sp. MPI-SDFR-AT-0126]|nr:hypothetical protein BKA64DRAFT_664448 [Leotiomycetes sp. MPI-SDFR-AT-0126]
MAGISTLALSCPLVGAVNRRESISPANATPLPPSFPHKAAISVPPCWLLCSATATLDCLLLDPVGGGASFWLAGLDNAWISNIPLPSTFNLHSTPPLTVILQSLCFPASATSTADINRNL